MSLESFYHNRGIPESDYIFTWIFHLTKEKKIDSVDLVDLEYCSDIKDLTDLKKLVDSKKFKSSDAFFITFNYNEDESECDSIFVCRRNLLGAFDTLVNLCPKEQFSLIKLYKYDVHKQTSEIAQTCLELVTP